MKVGVHWRLRYRFLCGGCLVGLAPNQAPLVTAACAIKLASGWTFGSRGSVRLGGRWQRDPVDAGMSPRQATECGVDQSVQAVADGVAEVGSKPARDRISGKRADKLIAGGVVGDAAKRIAASTDLRGCQCGTLSRATQWLAYAAKPNPLPLTSLPTITTTLLYSPKWASFTFCFQPRPR